MRPIRPKEEQEDSPPNLNAVPESRSSKRRCVSSACIPCRKRKSKCDGGVPSCSTCTAVYHTECVYDIDSDHRRKAALKRDIATLRERNGALGVIVASIRTSTDSEVADIVQQIRADENLEAIADSINKNMTLPCRSNSHTLEGDLSDVMGKRTLDGSGETRHFGHTSSLGLVSDGEQLSRNYTVSNAWTTVTRDTGFVGHLMELYFCWQHPFYVVLSKECFVHDMSKGRSKYCSPLLVNALLAIACGFSDRPEARMNPLKPKTVGDHFFAEARRLLFEDEHSSLTTVQALALMGLREASCGRDSNGFQYAGRCIRMALELGLHLSFTAEDLTPTEIEVRKITFWGCFTLDTAWSICIGRISQLPRAAISLDKPTIVGQLEAKPWKPYNDSDISTIEQPSNIHSILHHFSLISEIVNDTIFMCYAPRERFTSKKLLDFHSRYSRWYKELPTSLQLTGPTPLPQLIALHMYYHTVQLHLFRPFLKVDLTESSICPRGICISSAESISLLASEYRRLYGFRRVCLLVPHMILSASIIHILDLPKPSASQHLVQGMEDLHEMSTNHAFANRCLRIIIGLGDKWGIQIPIDVITIADELTPEASFSITPTSDVPIGDAQVDNQDMTSPFCSPPQSNTVQQYHPLQKESIDSMLMPSSDFMTRLSANPPDFFWSPFPDLGYPLQATQERGPMDIAAMLDVRNDDWDQFNRDGFRIATPDEPAYRHHHAYNNWVQD